MYMHKQQKCTFCLFYLMFVVFIPFLAQRFEFLGDACKGLASVAAKEAKRRVEIEHDLTFRPIGFCSVGEMNGAKVPVERIKRATRIDVQQF